MKPAPVENRQGGGQEKCPPPGAVGKRLFDGGEEGEHFQLVR